MTIIMNRKRRNIAASCLVMATFLNPLGYDILVHHVNELTGSYWRTMQLFYALSLVLFVLYFTLSKINPFRFILDQIKKVIRLFKI